MGRAAADFATAMAMGVADKMRRLQLSLFDSYHPELHYMRGPGPKWREKHGLPVTAELGDIGIPSVWKAGA